MGSYATRVSLEGRIGVRILEGGVCDVFKSDNHSNFNAENVDKGKGGISYEVSSAQIDSAVNAVNSVIGMSDDRYVDQNTRWAHLETSREEERKGGKELTKNGPVLVSHSLHLTVDEGTDAKMASILKEITTRTPGCEFEVGDMVWGKVKSHPWWPGQVLDEGFAEPAARRTKREGHVLVSFYADDSYGWFDPVELIPFDYHYAEKSKQTNACTFVRAVEEAVNEVARRAALGLVCNCQSPNCFLATSIEGFFLVHLNGYEHCGVYSAEQIKRARDGFQPVKMHSFLLEMAVMPFISAERSVDCIKNASTVLAYRNVVFGEIDEPYLQARGLAVHSDHLLGVLVQPEKVSSSQAPLSKPLEAAGTLGERKGSTGPTKIKHQQKRSKFLGKQIDESDKSEVNFSLEQQRSLVPPVCEEEAAPLVAGGYVLQRRSSPVSVKHKNPRKQGGIVNVDRVNTISRPGITVKEVRAVDKQPLLANDSSVDAEVNATEVLLPDEIYGSDFSGKSESLGLQSQGKAEATVDYKLVDEEYLDGSQGFQQPHSSLSQTVKNRHALDILQSAGGVDVSSINGWDGKPMIVNHSGTDLHCSKSVMGKKRKKESSLEAGLEHPLKQSKSVRTKALARNLSGKSSLTCLSHQHDSQIDLQRKDNAVISTMSSNSLVAQSVVCLGNIEFSLAQLLHDLAALACDCLHGFEENTLADVQVFVLSFRSIVCQKSLAQVHLSEVESFEIRSNRSPSATVTARGNVMDKLSGSKPMKKVSKPRDHAKVGQNGGITACELKSLDFSEKSGNQKLLEARGGNPKEVSTMFLTKPMNSRKLGARIRAATRTMDRNLMGTRVPIKPANDKKLEVRTAEPTVGQKEMSTVVPRKLTHDEKLEAHTGAAKPTMLMMKFPPETSLPSIPELKARFVRFGPLHHFATRVFWSSSTCQVVFKHNHDAQAAYGFAIQNSSIFGNVKVNCQLRAFELPAPQSPESSNMVAEKTANKVSHLKSTSAGEPAGCFLHIGAQHKSSLNNPLVAAVGSTTGVRTEKSPGKFMLGGDKCVMGQLMVASNSNFNNSRNIGIKNFQQVIPPPMLPIISHSSQVPHVQGNREADHFDKASMMKYGRPDASYDVHTSASQLIDFSHRMLNVLKRCEDTVSRLKSQGYNTYGPL